MNEEIGPAGTYRAALELSERQQQVLLAVAAGKVVEEPARNKPPHALSPPRRRVWLMAAPQRDLATGPALRQAVQVNGAVRKLERLGFIEPGGELLVERTEGELLVSELYTVWRLTDPDGRQAVDCLRRVLATGPAYADHAGVPAEFADAVAAARRVLGDVPEERVAAALEAAAEVQQQLDQAEADRLVAETGLAGMDIEDGHVRLQLVLAHDLAVKLTLAARTMLDAHPGAENYIQQEVRARDTGERYAYIIVKPGGKTPHQLRREAEAEVKRLGALLAEVRALHYPYRPAHADVETCGRCNVGMELVLWPCPNVRVLDGGEV